MLCVCVVKLANVFFYSNVLTVSMGLGGLVCLFVRRVTQKVREAFFITTLQFAR